MAFISHLLTIQTQDTTVIQLLSSPGGVEESTIAQRQEEFPACKQLLLFAPSFGITSGHGNKQGNKTTKSQMMNIYISVLQGLLKRAPNCIWTKKRVSLVTKLGCLSVIEMFRVTDVKHICILFSETDLKQKFIKYQVGFRTPHFFLIICLLSHVIWSSYSYFDLWHIPSMRVNMG